MFSISSTGFARELQAILTLYLGTVLIGFSLGFSAVAIPDINNEMRNRLYWLNHSFYISHLEYVFIKCDF